jgi:hypothetical protein
MKNICIVFVWRAWNSMICWCKLSCKMKPICSWKISDLLSKNKEMEWDVLLLVEVFCDFLLIWMLIFLVLKSKLLWEYLVEPGIMLLSQLSIRSLRKISFIRAKTNKTKFYVSNDIKIKLHQKNLWSKKQCLPTIFNIFPF